MHKDLPITVWLKEMEQGDEEAKSRVFEHLDRELREIAQRLLRREHNNASLQPTLLINEAYIKLFHHQSPSFKDRSHFLALVTRVVRHLLIDHARQKKAGKRDGNLIRIPLADDLAKAARNDVSLLDMDQHLNALNELSPRQHDILELRFFGGMTFEEIGVVLGASPSYVRKQTKIALGWLRTRMS